MILRITLEIDSGKRERMSKWSQTAFSKFSDKEQLGKLSREIFDSGSQDKIDYIFKMFEEEVAEFNKDSGNKDILSYRYKRGEAFFSVTRNGSGTSLKVTFAKRGEININGCGGLDFNNDILIMPDTEKNNCYFADSKGHPIDINEAVHKSLNALLGI